MTRTYRSDPVPAEALERIAGTVRRVPSAGFSQGQRLVVVTEEDRRRAVAAACREDAYERPWISAAPALVVVGVTEGAYHRRYTEADKLDDGREIEWPVPYWFVDGGALMMLVLLAAIDEGLACGFAGAPDTVALRQAVGFPEEVQPIGVVTLGFAADADPIRTSRSAARRRPLDELVRRERWS